MPKAAKTLDNMSKNLTKAERSAREDAEAAVMPERTVVKLKPPAYVRSDKVAAKYWRGILKRMEGISLLDDLDTEILAVYCSMISRRDATKAMFASLLKESEADELDGESRVAILGKIYLSGRCEPFCPVWGECMEFGYGFPQSYENSFGRYPGYRGFL